MKISAQSVTERGTGSRPGTTYLCRAVGPPSRPRETRIYNYRAADSRLTHSLIICSPITNDIGWGASLVAGLLVW